MATPNLDLPQLASGSFNLAPAYNEAMQKLDIAVQLAVQDNTLTAPPTTVAGDAGKRWIVAGPTPTGAWAGHADDVAYCVGADLWAYATPELGWVARVLGGPNAGKTFSNEVAGWTEATLGGSLAATSVTYDNAASGLVAANVQDAIDELAGSLGGGGVTSVNGASGVVTLGTEDLKSTVTALSIASGVVNIDCSLGRDFTLALTANVTSITFSNLPGAGFAAEIDVTMTQDATGSRTVALPASFKALGGSDTAVASAANAVTELAAKSKDNGTTWRYAMQESA